MSDIRVLVIDDDRALRASVVDLIAAKGWVAKDLARATDAQRWIAEFRPDVILSDVRMPGISGLDMLKSLSDSPPVVLISAHGDIPVAVEAMRHGAYSFIEKPHDPKRLLTILEHAAEQYRLRQSNARLRTRLQQLSGLDRTLIGQTPLMKQLRDTITRIAESDASVLIQGETGTGKELVARALHDISNRCDGPFIAVNAAQVERDHLPHLALSAAGGTLFLDEICACPIDAQPVLLRLIEAKEILTADGPKPETVDLRVLSATNEDLPAALAEGRLREDLLHRLNTFDLCLPPLRDRAEDIGLLAQRFLADFATLYDRAPVPLSDQDLSELMAHDWPGNVRELRKLCERYIVLSGLSDQRIAQALTVEPGNTGHTGLRAAVAGFERQLIARALQKHGGKMEDVAHALGIGRRTLNEKIVKLGLDKDALL